MAILDDIQQNHTVRRRTLGRQAVPVQQQNHVRILFEKYILQVRGRKGISQRLLFPEMMELTQSEASALTEIMEDFEALGFELAHTGDTTYAIQGVPSELKNIDFVTLVRSMIDESMETGNDVKEKIYESLALSMARFTAISSGKQLSGDEMMLLVNQLFACQSPNYTPDGNPVISVVSDEDIEKKFR